MILYALFSNIVQALRFAALEVGSLERQLLNRSDRQKRLGENVGGRHYVIIDLDVN
jgi:hypothetical protein